MEKGFITPENERGAGLGGENKAADRIKRYNEVDALRLSTLHRCFFHLQR